MLLSLVLPAFAQWTATSEDVSPLHVMASDSAAKFCTEAARIYSSRNRLAVNLTFGTPADLAKRIQDGEAADLFISDQPEWLETLKQQGMLDVFSLTSLSHNRLVLAAPPKHYLTTTYPVALPFSQAMQDIEKRTLLVIADPEATPLGQFTYEALKAVHLWERIAPIMVKATSTEEAVFLVTEGNMAGFLFQSDAVSRPDIKIIATLPEEVAPSITYRAAVVAGESMPHAREFLAFLKSDEASSLWQRYGFDVIK